MEAISQFIDDFKEYDVSGEVTRTFTRGFCYWFSVILQGRFPGGRIFYDVVLCHFVYEYDGSFYDITGLTDDTGRLVLFDALKDYDEMVYERVLRDCVRKERL